MTRADQVMGTPHYMAPEQMERPRDVDHRADLFALGVVLYEMLTGSLPRGNFEPPSRRVHVDVRLDEIVLKALAREPERLYQHALEVKTDVEHAEHAPRAAPSGSTTRAPATLGGALEARRSLFAGPIRDARPMALFAVFWVALGALWNFGPFVYGSSLVILVALLAWILRLMLRDDEGLALGRGAAPRAGRIVAAALATAIALHLVHVGRWANWELGTPNWIPFASGTDVYRKLWSADPWIPLRQLGAAPDALPTVVFESAAFFGPFDAGRLPVIGWNALSALGFVVLTWAIFLWLSATPDESRRRRALRVSLELGFQAAVTYFSFWSLAAVNYFRDVDLAGHATSAEITASVDEASDRLAALAERDGLRVDVDQRARIVDRRDGKPFARARILRIQAASPFDRWRCDTFGASRETPQIWAVLLQAEGPSSTTAQFQPGAYARESAEFVRACSTLDGYVSQLER